MRFQRLHVPAFEAHFTPSVEIAWRLAADHWGRGLATEGARAVVAQAFNTLALGEVMYPGVVQKILTNAVDGLDNYQELMRLLVEEKSALKVYMNVAGE